MDELKLRIVKEADGKNGDVANISNKEDLEAASFCDALHLVADRAKAVQPHQSIPENILTLVTDPIQQKIIRDNLGTEVPRKGVSSRKNWRNIIFENTRWPAAVTLLTKLQSDVRYAEGEKYCIC